MMEPENQHTSNQSDNKPDPPCSMTSACQALMEKALCAYDYFASLRGNAAFSITTFPPTYDVEALKRLHEDPEGEINLSEAVLPSYISYENLATVDMRKKLHQLGKILGYSDTQQQDFLYQSVHPAFVGPHTYTTLLEQTNRIELMTRMYETLSSPQDQSQQYIAALCNNSPATSIVANELLLRISPEPDRGIPSEFAGWYKETIAIAASTHYIVEEIFTQLANRCTNTEKSLVRFLHAWQSEIQQTLAEATNLANVFALHGDTLITSWPWFPRPFGVDTESLCAFTTELLTTPQIETLPLLRNPDTYRGERVPLPVTLSTIDISEYLLCMQRHWKLLLGAIQVAATMTEGRSNILKLRNTFKVLCRPFPSAGKQARLTLLPQQSDFQDFNLRIDQERDSTLRFDFSGIDYETALAHCTYFTNEKKEFFRTHAGYNINDQWPVNKRGQLNKYHPFYKLSVIKGKANLTQGQKLSLIALTLAQQGSTVGLRDEAPLSYHFTGAIHKSGLEDDFSTVVSDFANMLQRKPNS